MTFPSFLSLMLFTVVAPMSISLLHGPVVAETSASFAPRTRPAAAPPAAALPSAVPSAPGAAASELSASSTHRPAPRSGRPPAPYSPEVINVRHLLISCLRD